MLDIGMIALLVGCIGLVTLLLNWCNRQIESSD